MKNAIDNVFLSFAFCNKPTAAVGYSTGIRAIEHLAHESVPVRNTVVIPLVADAFNEHREPSNPMTSISLEVVLDDLPDGLQRLKRHVLLGAYSGSLPGLSGDGRSLGF